MADPVILAPVKLPRLGDNWATNTGYFARLWNQAMAAIENSVNGVIDAINKANAAQTTADQAEADAQLGIANAATAQATANQAETDAQTAIALAGTKQDHSTNLDLYSAGDTPSPFTLSIVDSVDAGSWRTAIGAGTSSSTGTVTSVAFSTGSTGFGVSGSPITSSGTFTLSGILNVANGGTGNTTGNAVTATALQTGRTLGITGDLTWTSPTFDGSSNVTAAGTLATVNANVGSFGSATAVPSFTVNAKGLITAVSTTAIPTLGSGTYTPTGTILTNVTTLTPLVFHYLRVGNTVTLSGRVNVTPTASGNVSFALALPVASNFGNGGTDAGGTASTINNVGTGAAYADATNKRIEVDMSNTTSGSAIGVWVHVTYLIN